MNFKFIYALLSFLLFTITLLGQTQIGNDIEEPSFNDAFGESLAMSGNGNRVIVGSPFWEPPGTDDITGLARVYELQNGEWIQIGSNITGDSDNDNLGYSLDISEDGNRIVVGIRNAEASDGWRYGAVKVYDWSNGDWVQAGETIWGENISDKCGALVSMSNDGNKILVGYIGYNNPDFPGFNEGLVRIFEWDNNSWSQIGSTLLNDEGESVGLYGAISGDGNAVAITSKESANIGVVRLYYFENGDWNQIGDPLSSNIESNFGAALSLSFSGNTLAVGLPRSTTSTSTGRVVIYEFIDGNFAGGDVIINPDNDNRNFGKSVDLSGSGDRIIIGAGPGVGGGGMAISYEHYLDDWIEISTFSAASEDDNFGHAVSISNNGHLVGVTTRGFSPNNTFFEGRASIYSGFFAATISENNPTCIGGATGSLLIRITVAPSEEYSYSVFDDTGLEVASGMATSTTFTVDNLNSGTYTLIVTDANSTIILQNTAEVFMVEGSFFEISDITTTNTTNGLSNGNITITTEGGTPDFEYSWSGPTSGSNSDSDETLTIGGCLAGDYTVMISDANGNSLTNTVTILDEDDPESTCSDPLDIVILNDVSGSVDGQEYLESKDFFSAFCSSLNIGTGPEDTQVAIMEWSSTNEVDLKIPLTGNLSDLTNYTSMDRSFAGGTYPNDALTSGYNYLEQNGRDGVTKILVLSTDGAGGQISSSLVDLADQYKSEGYTISTIAFDNAFNSQATMSILQEVASIGVLSPGATTYAELTDNLANNIVNVYICAATPGSSNTFYFNQDGTLELNDFDVAGGCFGGNSYSSVEVTYTVTASQQLSLQGGMPVTFYKNNPNNFGATKILTTYIPCAVIVGTSETFTVNLPISSPTDIWGVLNDDGSQTPPLNFPITSIDETVFANNIDHIPACYSSFTGIEVFKYTTTPTPTCGNTVIYIVNVCNTGSEDLFEIDINDQAANGFALVNTSAELNGCATENNDAFDIPVGCCVYITYEYNVENASDGFYDDQNADAIKPGGQLYRFDGENYSSEDVAIGDGIDCDSDEVIFDIYTDISETCDDRFVTCHFEIINNTNTNLYNAAFSANSSAPAVWAGSPFGLNNVSIGSTNFDGLEEANFMIAFIEANSICSFSLDVYLGDWENSNNLNVTATLSELPSYVNGNGTNLQTTLSNVGVNAGVIIDTDSVVEIIPGDNAQLSITLNNGQNPVWSTSGDGMFDDINSAMPTYTPGPMDIENGTVEVYVTAENIIDDCDPGNSTILISIEPVSTRDNLENNALIVSGILTPNGDGFQDYLTLFSEEVVNISSLEIYNTVGNKIWKSNNIIANDATSIWDGRVNGRMVPAGIYVYHVLYSVNDKMHEKDGRFLVVN